jgi:hypothetical protein
MIGTMPLMNMIRAALCVLLVFSLAACRQSQQATPQNQTAVTIELEVSPEPPATGESTLLITLTDKDGQPIHDAMLAVRGDMTHAGMQPVSAVAEENAADGLYRVPFQWTMSGDWVVTVTVTLPNGEIHTKTFDMTVSN